MGASAHKAGYHPNTCLVVLWAAFQQPTAREHQPASSDALDIARSPSRLRSGGEGGRGGEQCFGTNAQAEAAAE
jgi:hypothetical protein